MTAELDVQVGERAVADDIAELAEIEAEIPALVTAAREAKIHAEKVEIRSRIETYAAGIDWDALPGETVTLKRHDRSVVVAR